MGILDHIKNAPWVAIFTLQLLVGVSALSPEIFLPRALEPRAHSPLYDSLLPKGKKLMEEVNNDKSPVASDVTLHDLEKAGWKMTTHAAQITQNRFPPDGVLQIDPAYWRDKLPEGTNCTKVEAWYNAANSYINFCCPTIGLIIATNNKRTDSKLPHWSVVSYAIFANISAEYESRGFPVIKLAGTFRSHISNPITNKILEEIGGNWQPRKGVLRPTQDDFNVVIATPNGLGTAHIILERRATEGHKTISEILARKYFNNWSFLVSYQKVV